MFNPTVDLVTEHSKMSDSTEIDACFLPKVLLSSASISSIDKELNYHESDPDYLHQAITEVKSVKSVQSALSDLKRLQSQCNYRPFIT